MRATFEACDFLSPAASDPIGRLGSGQTQEHSPERVRIKSREIGGSAMQGCGKRIEGATMYTIEGQEKQRNNNDVFCGVPFPSASFPEWTYFCAFCALKAGWWSLPF
jgi:hypothetical protein